MNKPTKSKLNERFEFLTFSPKFRLDVIEIRKKYSIPEDGFATQYNISAWESRLRDDTDAYFFNRPKIIDDYEEFNSKSPHALWKTDCEALRKKYKIPDHFAEGFRGFILCSRNPTSSKLSVSHGFEGSKFQSNNLVVNIYPDTTLEDVRELWPFIQQLQKDLRGHTKQTRNKQSEKFQLKKRVLELHVKKYTAQAIAKQIRYEFGDFYAPSEIRMLISRIKKENW